VRECIGGGRAGFQWKGTHKITVKKENPDWTAPAEMVARQPDVPRRMKGGDPANPLGTHAMYLGSTLYRIHGSPDADSVGEAESSGCFRMRNTDVADLYKRVPVGTTVVVQEEAARLLGIMMPAFDPGLIVQASFAAETYRMG